MNIIHDNLITLVQNKKFDLVLHGCNCFNTMGAGIALQIKNTFPSAFEADQKTKKGGKSKLGSFSKTYESDCHIINAYTQYSYGNDQIHFNEFALIAVLQKIKKDIPNVENMRIGYPLVGGGLAGGDPEKIKAIFEKEFKNLNHTLVLFKP